jgi:hypothetical protein
MDPARQKALLKRLKAESRRWILRGVLFVLLAVVSFRRGGSLFVTMGAAFVLLAAMSVLLSRQNARGARELATKLALLNSASTNQGTTPHSPIPK